MSSLVLYGFGRFEASTFQTIHIRTTDQIHTKSTYHGVSRVPFKQLLSLLFEFICIFMVFLKFKKEIYVVLHYMHKEYCVIDLICHLFVDVVYCLHFYIWNMSFKCDYHNFTIKKTRLEYSQGYDGLRHFQQYQFYWWSVSF